MDHQLSFAHEMSLQTLQRKINVCASVIITFLSIGPMLYKKVFSGPDYS